MRGKPAAPQHGAVHAWPAKCFTRPATIPSSPVAGDDRFVEPELARGRGDPRMRHEERRAARGAARPARRACRRGCAALRCSSRRSASIFRRAQPRGEHRDIGLGLHAPVALGVLDARAARDQRVAQELASAVAAEDDDALAGDCPSSGSSSRLSLSAPACGAMTALDAEARELARAAAADRRDLSRAGQRAPRADRLHASCHRVRADEDREVERRRAGR